MAAGENTTEIETANLLVGKVAILYGNVKAVASDGTERVLAVNSPIFAHDRIMTGSDGMVSIVIDDAAQTQIDIGRMSDVVIDEDIFAGISGAEATEAAAEVEQIQELLLAEGDTFDPTTELEAPAAGGVASAGGGHPVPVFDRITHEGEVTSGAETTGITTTNPEPITGIVEEPPPEPIIATVTLTASESVEEGNTITYTATLDKVPDSPVTVELSNGATIVIPAGEKSASVIVDAPADDIYIDPDSVSAKIDGITIDGFDEVIVDNTPAVTQIPDTIDPTVVSLTATPVVPEGENEGTPNQITYTATLTNPPQSPITVTLSNGEVITIASGETSGSVTVDAPTDDVYVDAETIGVTIEGVTTDNFEQLNIDVATAETYIPDTIDDTVLILDDVTVDEGTGTATIKASLTNPTDTAMTVTLTNGATIDFAAGASTGTSTPFVIQGDDPWWDGEDYTVGVAQNRVVGGNFENLITTDTALVTLNDTIDDTVLTLDDVAVDEGTSTATINASLTNPTDTEMTVTLTNGATIDFAAGASTGTSTPFAIQGDDPYWDGENYSVGIAQDGVVGGNFENLITTDTALVTLNDTIDTTTVSIIGPEFVVEGQTTGEYTLTLSNPPQSDVTVNLTYSGVAQDGADFSGVHQVVFNAGTTTFTIPTVADGIPEGAESYTVTIGSVSGGNFELVQPHPTENSVQTTIVEPLDTAATVEETDMDLSVDPGDLAASNSEGSTPDGTGETVSGSLNIEQGWTAVAESGTTPYGSYEINADGTYTYTLLNSAGHDAPPSTDQVIDTIFYTVESDGVTNINTLTISINDDGPVAVNDFTATPDVNDGESSVAVDLDTLVSQAGADGVASIELTGQSGTYGTVTVNNGQYTYTANEGLQQVNGSDTATFTITDNDGDTDTVTVTFNVADNEPPTVAVQTTDGVVDDSGLPGGTDEGNNLTASGTMNINAGTSDTYTMTVDGTLIDPANDASGGTLISSGNYGDLYVKSTGEWTYTLDTNYLGHTPPDHNDLAAQVEQYSVTVTDDSGTFTSATDTIYIDILDDGPVANGANDVTTWNYDGDPVTGALNVTIGVDGNGGYTFTGFADGDQGYVNGSTEPNMTSGGDAVFLYGSGTNILTGTTDHNDPNATLFSVTLNNDGTYTLDMAGTLDSPVAFNVVNLGDIGITGGNGSYIAVGSGTADVSDDILITAVQPGGTLNTSANDIGTESQWVKAATGIRFEFVDHINSDSNLSDGFDGDYRNLTGVSMGLAEVKGGDTQTNVLIALYAGADATTNNIIASDYDAVTSIKFISGGQEYTIDTAGGPGDYHQTFDGAVGLLFDHIASYEVTNGQDGSNFISGIVIYNVDENTSVGITSNEGFHTADFVNYEDIDHPSQDFAVNSISGAYITNDPVSFDSSDTSFIFTDADGDPTQADNFTVHLNPVIEGTNGPDILDGGDHNDLMLGQDGADVMHGHGGDDTLDGGTGADTLTGGAGNDTFKVGNGDTITDYAAGDNIDASGVVDAVNYEVVDVGDHAGINFLDAGNATIESIEVDNLSDVDLQALLDSNGDDPLS